MIRGDSSDYELLEKWTKDFDCQGYKSCEIGGSIVTGKLTAVVYKIN